MLNDNEHVDHVVELLTMALGPSTLLVAARLDLADGLDSDDIEAAAAELENALRDAVPAIRYVFLDPTSRHERPLATAPGA